MRHIKPYESHLRESVQDSVLKFEAPRPVLDRSVNSVPEEDREYLRKLVSEVGNHLDGKNILGWSISYDGFMNNYHVTNLNYEQTDGSIIMRVTPFFENDDYILVDGNVWNEKQGFGGDPFFPPYSVYDVTDYITGKEGVDVNFFSELITEIIRRSVEAIDRSETMDEIEPYVDTVPYKVPPDIADRARKKRRSRGAFGRF